jgi:hypothetical protein
MKHKRVDYLYWVRSKLQRSSYMRATKKQELHARNEETGRICPAKMGRAHSGQGYAEPTVFSA